MQSRRCPSVSTEFKYDLLPAKRVWQCLNSLIHAALCRIYASFDDTPLSCLIRLARKACGCSWIALTSYLWKQVHFHFNSEGVSLAPPASSR